MVKEKNADTFRHAGAKALAREIEQYWAARGAVVKTEVMKIDDVEEYEYTEDGNHLLKNLWCVRSDMVNGLPRVFSSPVKIQERING